MENLTTTTTTKFCKHCGEKIPKEAVICTKCGCQVEEISALQPSITINNSNNNSNTNINANLTSRIPYGRLKSKWVAFTLCFFLGLFGAHKFYEGKIGMGILYLFTAGLLGVGWIADILILLSKPNLYFVR